MFINELQSRFENSPTDISLSGDRKPYQAKNEGTQKFSESNKILPDLEFQQPTLGINKSVPIEVDESGNHVDAKIVYWAALRGKDKLVQAAFEVKKMSPFIKCFAGSNIVTAAIIGNKVEVLTLILSYRFKTKDSDDNDKKLLMTPDDQGNIPLHYAYSFNRPLMRDLLRNYQVDLRKKM